MSNNNFFSWHDTQKDQDFYGRYGFQVQEGGRPYPNFDKALWKMEEVSIVVKSIKVHI